MSIKENQNVRISIGDLEMWTAPFGKNKATISAREEGTKLYLLNVHKKMPDVFELLVDDDDFCDEDLDGVFSVIVDPEMVTMQFYPGTARFGFAVTRPCDGDCGNCQYENCSNQKSEAPAKEDSDE